MSANLTAVEVLQRCMQALDAQEFDAAIKQFYADDVVLEHRFAMSVPSVLHGLDEVLDSLGSRGPSHAREFRLRRSVVHQTTDPEVVIAEWTSEGVTPDGHDFVANNVIVARVRDGKVLESRGYHDAVRTAPEEK